MIEHTFLHLPGIGQVKERFLWENSILTWDDLEKELLLGVPLSKLLHPNKEIKTKPGKPQQNKLSITHTDTLIANIQKSREALIKKDYDFFLSKLNPIDHWRVLISLINEALYLDIETTGLSRQLNYITVVGVKYKDNFHQWVWPEALEDLHSLLKTAPLIVTFNGKRFDVPFLQTHIPDIQIPKAHVDLLFLARSVGMKGGQKEIEQEFNLIRNSSIKGVSGAEAVTLWCKALYGDQKAYSRLLKYNRADVENLPHIATSLCNRLASNLKCEVDFKLSIKKKSIFVHKPIHFSEVSQNWQQSRVGFSVLESKLKEKFGRVPTVVGIDLRGSINNPTGWVKCVGQKTESKIVYKDEEIIALTQAAQPDLVSIDAPLFLPRGRFSVEDNSLCRAEGGIVRDAERILWSRGIRVYPALIRHMQGLTKRGIDLTKQLKDMGITVIESYPGAAQDILGIPRKGVDINLLRYGLKEFGFNVQNLKTHDELDALTSAIVGYFYLADNYEGIGANDEGYMILPKWESLKKWGNGIHHTSKPKVVCLAGLPGAGKTTLALALSKHLGWKCFMLGEALRSYASKEPSLMESLKQGNMAPEPLVNKLIEEAVQTTETGIIIDGFPRHKEQISIANTIFKFWSVIYLDIPPDVACLRISSRLVCSNCGFVKPYPDNFTYNCPSCSNQDWQPRLEDENKSVGKRILDAENKLPELLTHLHNNKIKVIYLDAKQHLDYILKESLFNLFSDK